MARTLGLTGSFGSGKSAVAALLSELAGAEVIDADELARQATEPGGPAYEEVIREFGPRALTPQGRLNRQALAEQVFTDRRALARLNALVHPRVIEESRRRIAALGDRALIVLDVPLLFESGMEELVDQVVVVAINERERFRRLARRGFHEREVIARLGMQMPQARKISRADCVIDNSGTTQETRKQVQTLLEQITREKNPRNHEREIQ